ncbi:DUF4139 domain-containing protein [Novosphingobium sp.]|uniref:DUF4139 domain-containing protein n=1 Tax=Novosphingobium sp. TaxID=1874826 RepID=UPI003D1512FB
MAGMGRIAGATLALMSTTALAQSAPAASAQGEVAVTIYNNDLALIEDQRRIDPGKGDVAIELPDVSAAIQPETVSLTIPDATILEQNFDYDLLSPARLLDKSVGQQVTLVHTNPATGADSGEPARVLANNGGTLLDVGGRIEILGDMSRSRLVFPGLPPGLKARPTLSVRLDSTRAGTRPVTLSYLSHGFSWKADYVALFDEGGSKDGAGHIDVQGWITLNNTTGTNFANARVLLVAGEVANTLGDGNSAPSRRYPPRGMVQMQKAGTETSGRERLGDFYVYPIAGRTTLANAQQKQVSFLDVKGASARKIYRYANGWLGNADAPQSAQSVIAFSTSAREGLGDALPAGMVRVYMRDARGQPQFIGEQAIGHTPMGSTLALPTGDAFDVKVQPTLVKRTKLALGEWEQAARWRVTTAGKAPNVVTVETAVTHWQTTMQYRVTNARPTPVTVEVAQSGLDNGWSDTRVPSESQPGEQRSIDERVWQVAVPANGEATLTVTFDTRY